MAQTCVDTHGDMFAQHVESFVEERSVDLIGTDHPHEPLVSNFVIHDNFVSGRWVLSAAIGEHRQFHTGVSVGDANHRPCVRHKQLRIGFDFFAGKFGGILPAIGFVAKRIRHDFDAVGRRCVDTPIIRAGEGEIIHVFGDIMPRFGARRVKGKLRPLIAGFEEIGQIVQLAK
jgi:hypothetical protein